MWPFRKKEEAPKREKNITVKAQRNAWSASATDRLFSNWSTVSQPINQQLEGELRSLRARSRELAKNEPYLRRFFQLCRSNIVGPKGFVLRSEVMRTNGNQDELAQDAIEAGWKAWGKRGVCCALDRFSLIEMENLICDQLFRDGELILIQHTGPNENKFGISFRFVDPELMDVNHKEKLKSGHQVRMGIETNRIGKVAAYHFHSTDSTHDHFYQIGGRGYIRIPAEFVIHRFVTEYVDQLRGYPHGAAAMLRMRMLNGYEEAELVAARNAASTMGFIERGEDGGGFEGEEDYDDEPMIEAEPGAFHYLENGSKLHDWKPDHPTTAYKEYVKGVLRGISSGLGVNYNTLANDLEGVNYSSLRGGVLEDREMWKAHQNWFIDQVMCDVFERWLRSALLMGALTLPRGLPLKSSNIERYRAHSFQGRRWAWVDPQKDMKANETAIQLGLRSRSSIIREMGDDPDQVWREIEREQDTLEKLGLTMTPETEPEEVEEDGS